MNLSENTPFGDSLVAERMITEFSLLNSKQISKAQFNKLRRATIVSVDHEIAVASLLDSSNQIQYVKIRPGLRIEAGDEVYIQAINNSLNNIFIDTKIIDIQKMFDLETDLLQSYAIETFQDNSGWSNSSPATDGDLENEEVWKKFGTQSFRISAPDNVARTLYAEKTYSLDLTQWEDTTESYDTDYIVWICYITDITKMNTNSSIRFETSSGNHFENIVLKASLQTGWNYIKTSKKDFTETGSPDWSNITKVRLSWTCTTNALDEYIAFTVFGMGEQKLENRFHNLINCAIQTTASRVVVNNSESSVTFNNNAITSDYVIMNVPMNQNWLKNDVYLRLYWEQVSSNIPNWLIQYRWQKNGTTKTTSWTSIAYQENIYTYSSGTLNQETLFAYIAPLSNPTLSDFLQIRVIRDTTNVSTLFAGSDPETNHINVNNLNTYIQVG